MVDWRITKVGLLSQAESSSTTCWNYDDATIAERDLQHTSSAYSQLINTTEKWNSGDAGDGRQPSAGREGSR